MAETFYRIKGERGYLAVVDCADDWQPLAAHAYPYPTKADADDHAARIRAVYDPTARVAKTTLKQSKCAGAWAGDVRFDDAGLAVVCVFECDEGGWRWSRRPGQRRLRPQVDSQAPMLRGVRPIARPSWWRDSKHSYATRELAQQAADRWLRKRGWRLA